MPPAGAVVLSAVGRLSSWFSCRVSSVNPALITAAHPHCSVRNSASPQHTSACHTARLVYPNRAVAGKIPGCRNLSRIFHFHICHSLYHRHIILAALKKNIKITLTVYIVYRHHLVKTDNLHKDLLKSCVGLFDLRGSICG